TNGGTRPPVAEGSYVSATLFWVVTGVLVVLLAVACFFLNKESTQNREELTELMTKNLRTQKTEFDTSMETQRKAVNVEMATVKEQNTKLEESKESLARNLKELSSTVSNFVETQYKTEKANL